MNLCSQALPAPKLRAKSLHLSANYSRDKARTAHGHCTDKECVKRYNALKTSSRPYCSFSTHMASCTLIRYSTPALRRSMGLVPRHSSTWTETQVAESDTHHVWRQGLTHNSNQPLEACYQQRFAWVLPFHSPGLGRSCMITRTMLSHISTSGDFGWSCIPHRYLR